MVTQSNLVERFSSEVEHGQGVLFVGSGISHGSIDVSWGEILRPLLSDINVEIDSNDDLPLMAQYIVNRNTGNRGALIERVIDLFAVKAACNSVHSLISKLNISTIWTTNYDTLLEKSFPNVLLDVKVCDDSISKTIKKRVVEIVKIHGCAERSSRDQIVITKEDYEDFFENKPAMAKKLCSDLVSKSFLFIGYGFRDQNIVNVLVKVRQLSNGCTRQHYLITKKVSKEELKKQKDLQVRQDLWCQELLRYGISVLLIDEYRDLEGILREIIQKSRGSTICVTGSHVVENGSNVEKFAIELGRRIASVDVFRLMNGQSSGVAACVLRGFLEACVHNKFDAAARVTFYPNPYAANEKFSNNEDYIPMLKEWRSGMFRSSRVLVLFGGGIGTRAEFELGTEYENIIIPVIVQASERKTALMQEVLSNKIVMSKIRSIDEQYYSMLTDDASIVSVDGLLNVLENIAS